MALMTVAQAHGFMESSLREVHAQRRVDVAGDFAPPREEGTVVTHAPTVGG
jgi:hypothetical protein